MVEYKFKIGDKVKVIKGGHGILLTRKGKIFTITNIGIYTGILDNEPGYVIDPPKGNSKTGDYDFMIGESSFELVKPTSWKEMMK